MPDLHAGLHDVLRSVHGYAVSLSWAPFPEALPGCILMVFHSPCMQTLKRGVEGGADSAAGWKALAELQYQNRQWQDCFNTSVKGLEWSQRRRSALPADSVLHTAPVMPWALGGPAQPL